MPTFTYVSVDSITPDSGTVFGGTAVTITGFGFDLATGVTIGGTAATSVVIVSNTTITAVTASHASGAVDVVVGNVDTLTAGYTYSLSQVLLPPIPYNSPVEDPISGKIDKAWFLWVTTVKQRVESFPGAIQIAAEQVIGVFNEAQIPELPWDRIEKDGSSLADLEVPGPGANGSFLSTQSGVPVWRTLGGGTAIVRDFDPGTVLVGANQWIAFPDYMVLAAGETVTLGAGAVLRIF